MANVQVLMINDMSMSTGGYNIFLLAMMLFYIGGILSYRLLIKFSGMPIVRIIILTVLLLGICWFSFFGEQIVNLILSLCLISFSLGYLIPFSTGSAMEVISKAFGMSSALFTFSFSIISSIWSFIEAHISISAHHFMVIASWISIILLFIFALLFFSKKYIE